MLLEFCDLTNVLLLYSSAKQLLGRCYRLEMIQCRVFARAMMLFGLHITTADDEYVGQQQMYGTVSNNFLLYVNVCAIVADYVIIIITNSAKKVLFLLCLFVCLLASLCENYSTDLDKI